MRPLRPLPLTGAGYSPSPTRALPHVLLPLFHNEWAGERLRSGLKATQIVILAML